MLLIGLHLGRSCLDCPETIHERPRPPPSCRTTACPPLRSSDSQRCALTSRWLPRARGGTRRGSTRHGPREKPSGRSAAAWSRSRTTSTSLACRRPADPPRPSTQCPTGTRPVSARLTAPGRRHHRQGQSPRVRLWRHHAEPPSRSLPQSVGSGPHPRRVKRRLGRQRRGGHVSCLAGLGHGRLDPHPRRPQRRGRAASHGGARAQYRLDAGEPPLRHDRSARARRGDGRGRLRGHRRP
jgi:hypothetical protein